MKLKYKKIILFISFGIMFIGLIVFSMIPSKKQEKPTIATPSSSPVNKDEPTASDSYMKKNAYPEVNDLIKRYFDAKMTVNMDAMKTLVSDISHVNEKKLRTQLEYIEGMENIECYTIDGVVQGTYRVYVYYQLKIRNIDTLAPALTGFYVTKNPEGSYIIYLSTVDDGVQKFIEESDASKEAKDLKDNVRVKLEEALNQDAQLKNFYEMLEQGSMNTENGQESNETNEQGQ